MNREIKIKVATISNVDNRLIEISEPMSVKKVGDYIDERRDKDGVERYEYIQWTGLHDKNGVEIYEGDVIKEMFSHGEEKCEIVFEKAGFFIKNEKAEISDNLHWHYNGLEVIGNVFENPDLLNK